MQKLTKISYFASCQQYFANLVNGETHRLIIHTQPSLFISRCQLKAIKFRKFYLYLLADTLLSPFHAHLCWLPTLKCQLTASTATFLNIFFLGFFFFVFGHCIPVKWLLKHLQPLYWECEDSCMDECVYTPNICLFRFVCIYVFRIHEFLIFGALVFRLQLFHAILSPTTRCRLCALLSDTRSHTPTRSSNSKQ